ncbi:MAG: hypothetical protein COA78_11730 [Blastopirellula sp.]|nr:MAG: hypothetical protein COA78_11730 [Blastopirellula sp.]
MVTASSIRYGFFLACLLVLLSLNSVPAKEPVPWEQVSVLFKKHCVECHGPDAQESDLRVDSPASLHQGGESGEPAVTPNEPELSELLTRLTTDDEDLRMPPESKALAQAEIDLIRRWIKSGAEQPTLDPNAELATTDHWSFQPLAFEVPNSQPGNSINPVDAFIFKSLQKAKLNPSPAEQPAQLIRRVYFVMHGMPPSHDQVTQFVSAYRRDSQTAYSDLIEQVLAGPEYGERWARHWLDVVRFGETDGFETNRERPYAWRYRDYVIQSLNEDKPYDQFIREQIAGDAFDAAIGTGFLVGGPHDIVNGQDPISGLLKRQDDLADMVNTTGTAFLGLTLGCARCHNHKFDPVSQKDYYSIQAVFAGVNHGDQVLPVPADQVEKLTQLRQSATDLKKNLTEFLPEPNTAELREPVNSSHNVDHFKPVMAKQIRFTVLATNTGQPCIDELEIFSDEQNVALASSQAIASCSSSLPGYAIHKLQHVNDGKYGNSYSWISNEKGGGWVQIDLPEPTMIQRVEWGRDRTGKIKDRTATEYKIEVAVEPDNWVTVSTSADRSKFGTAPTEPAYDFTSATAERATLGRKWKQQLNETQQQIEVLSETPKAYVGTFSQPGATHRLYRGEPTAKREEVEPNTIRILGDLQLATDSPEQQRRVAFANWLASSENPLTARVIVNRIWQHHFGRGIVETPSDFGANGVAPSHPELLDWLANQLVTHGWSLKHIHRIILQSSTFRQSSRPNHLALKIDASSQLLWRFPPRRLEAEAIRDSILATSGSLNPVTGGPGFSAFEIEPENVRHYFPKKSYGPNDWRRMIYMTKVRQEQDATFGMFDCPDGSQVSPKRSRSTTPLQALNLLNSTFVIQQTELLAARIMDQHADNTGAQVDEVYRRVFQREPDSVERQAASALVKQHGLAAMCRALFNSNEFLFIP